MLPVSDFLEKKGGIGRISSSFISTLILFVVVGIIFYFLFRQMGVFVDDLVERKKEILDYVEVLRVKLMSSTGVSLQQQEEMYRDRLAGIIDFVQGFISTLLAGLAGTVLKFLLVLIYVFLLLINRDKFVQFVLMYIDKEKHQETHQIITETRKVAHKYLWGRLQVMSILGIMYLITFLSYGLEHTALLVLFGMLITVIPYLGPFLSGTLPILFMMVFGGSTVEIASFAILVIIIQLIESYVLEPVIIGSEVKQSPLFVIISVVIGGALWGAAGLILFVPIFGILKIIFDHSQKMRPVGFLMGYDRPGARENLLEKIQKKMK